MKRVLNAPKFKENPNIIRSPSIPKKYPRLTLVGNYDLYLVNESDEVLKSVKASPWGFSGVLTLESDKEFVYEDVQPGEGVLVYEPLEDDGFYYSDFVTGIDIYLETDKLGKVRIQPNSSKKGVKEQILQYQDLTAPRMVMISSDEDN